MGKSVSEKGAEDVKTVGEGRLVALFSVFSSMIVKALYTFSVDFCLVN